MKKENGKWFFESHDEIRAYVAQKMPENVLVNKQRHLYVSNDLVINENSGKIEGNILDRPAGDFYVEHNFVRRDIRSGLLLDAFYKAGDDLASRLRTFKAEHRHSLTAKELTVSELKGGPLLVWPSSEDGDILYTITTGTACYNVPQERLFWAIDHMEKVEGVSPNKRRRFNIKADDGACRDVVARFSFEADKVLPRMKKCYDGKDTLRPTMQQPAVELRTGIMISSDGHVLAAHRLKGYDAEIGETPYDVVSVPREVVSMKGTITVEAENTKDGLVVVATDSAGRSAQMTQKGRYPNWRSVFPQRVSVGIDVNPDAWLDGVKRVAPCANAYSNLMRMDAERGGNSVVFSAEDYDSSKTTTATVPVPEGVVPGLWIGVKASIMADVLAFRPTLMHWVDPSRAMLFMSDDVVIIVMPMLISDVPITPRGPLPGEMMTFSIDKWVDDACKAAIGTAGTKKEPKPAKPVAKAAPKPITKPAPVAAMAAAVSLEDRLREALRRQLRLAA